MRLKLKLALIVAIAGLCVGVWPGIGQAAAGVIYLSPSGTSVRKDNDVTMALRINPGTAVDSVQATVNYSTSSLEFVSLSLGGTFTTCVRDSGGGGTVTFACAELDGSTSSDSLIADITFKALSGSGNTPLTISDANAAVNGGYTNPSSSGATVDFTSPPSTTAPRQSSTSSSNSGSSTAASPSQSTTPKSTTTNKTATPATVSPKVTVTVTAAVTKVQITNATVKASVSAADQLYVQYGTTKSDLNLMTQSTQPNQSADIQLDQPALAPVTLYYYQVVAKDSSGSVVGESPINTLVTRGYSVSVTVLDSHYHPIAGKTVTLHSVPMQATTNSEGIATFTDVAPGLHHIDYSVRSHNYSQAVYVASNVVTEDGVQSSAPQTVAVVLSDYTQPAGSKTGVIIIILLTVIVIASILLTEREAAGKLIASMKKHNVTVLPIKPPTITKAPPSA